MLETVLTGRNLLSPVLTGAAADVTAFDAKVAASQEKASLSAETSAKAQTTAAERVQAANARTATSSSEAAAKVTAANTRTAESASVSSAKVVSANARAGESARLFADASESSAARAGAAWHSLATKALPVALAAGIVVTAKMAGDYQQLVTKLETTAGETKANIGMVSQGMLDMAGQVGISAKELATGMYTVESAGYHGAAGLNVLKASAQGARQENADLGKVADAVSTILHDYHLPASQAATVTSELVTAVSHGKTTFDELTGSLHSVTPLASVLGVTIADVTGTLSAMTASGMSADQATQNMADTLRHLASPTSTMTAELAQLGITSSDLSNDLSTKGLAGTLQLVEGAIVNHLDPATKKVLLPALNQSKTAAQDLKIMMASMPAPVAKMAQSLLDGSTSVTAYSKAAKGLGGQQAAMALQFLSLYKNSDGFNNVLKAGGPAQQAFASAMAKSFGTASALSVALMTTGENAAATNTAVKDIAKSSGDAQGNIKGWSEVQGNFNQKLAQAGAEAKTLAIEAGQHLLPVLTGIVGWVGSTGIPAIGRLGSAVGDVAHWFSQLPGPVKDAAIALGIVKILGASDMFAGLVASGRILALSTAMNMRNAAASVRGLGAAYSAAAAEARVASAIMGESAAMGRVSAGIAGMGAAAGAAARGGVSLLSKGLGGVVSLLGGGFGIALIGAAAGFGAYQSAMQRLSDTTTTYFNLLKEGGSASQSFIDQQQQIAGRSITSAHSIGDAWDMVWSQFGDGIAQMHGYSNAADEAKKKGDAQYTAWVAGLDSVGRAQLAVTQATTAYNEAAKNSGPDSLAARNAGDQLRVAQEGLATAQNQVNTATQTHLQLLQQQKDAEVGAVNSALGAQIAQDNLATAIDRYNYNAKLGSKYTGNLKDDSLALAQQVYQTATQTAQAAADQAKANGVTDTSVVYNNTLHAALDKNAKLMAGPGKDAVVKMTAVTAKSTIEHGKLDDAIGKLGLNVVKTWDGNTKEVSGATEAQKKMLQSLGLKIVNLPGMPGHPANILVTASTAPADKTLSDFALRAQKMGFVGAIWNLAPTGHGPMAKPGIPGLPAIPGHATGGPITGPGSGTSDSVLIAASNGEHMWTAAETRAAGGHSGVEALRRAVLSGGGGRANGGPIVNYPVDWNAAAMKQANAALTQFAASMAGPPGSGVERWRSTVDQVLRLLGQPTSYDNGVLAMIQAESGGNPRAINLTDSNAAAGHPSQGLMQTIPGTFAAYAGPYISRGITDGFANIYAGVNYALHRYGPGILASGGRHSAPGHYVGYKTGTDFVPNDGLAYLHRGEAVVPAERNFTPTGAPGYSAAPVGHTTVTVAAPQVTVQARVFLGSREITDIVRVEATSVVNGRLEDLHRKVTYR